MRGAGIDGAGALGTPNFTAADKFWYGGTNGLTTEAAITATGRAAAQGQATVEESTAGSGAPNILTAAESGSVMTNAGSSATNYHTLPTAAAGLMFTFIDNDASDLLRVVANSGDTIRLKASVSIAAGYAESSAQGDVIVLVATNATEWVATSIHGTWNLETS